MKFNKVALAISVVSLVMAGGAQAGSNSNAAMMAELKAMNRNMNALQNQVTHLQGQVSTLKGKLSHLPANKRVSTYTAAHVQVSPANKNQVIKGHHHPLNPNGMAYQAFGNSVVIAPFTSVPTYSNGSQLIVNSPSINEDARLLQRRQQEVNAIIAQGDTPPNHPRLVFSGSIEGIAQILNPYHGAYQSDVDLATAQLDSFIEVAPWVSGFMAFQYDSAAGTFSANRIDNSRLFLDKGFITLGDFNKSPIFGSIGQFYVPFGRYSTPFISAPLTEFVGRTKARAVSVGYLPGGDNHPYVSAFAFRGESKNSQARVANFGGDVGYTFKVKKVNGDIGVSVINTISDAQGMQSNGRSTGFVGFNATAATERLKHTVPGLDVHGNIGIGPLSFVGEYVTATQDFARQDLTFNGSGAQPQALDAEATYSFHLFQFPTTFGVDFGKTWQSLALNIPKTRYGVVLQSVIAKYTILSLEYIHNINYSKSDTASGVNMTVTTSNELGRSSDQLTAQLGIYF